MVHVTVSPAAGPLELNLVPWPLSVQPAAGVLAGARIVATDAALLERNRDVGAVGLPAPAVVHGPDRSVVNSTTGFR